MLAQQDAEGLSCSLVSVARFDRPLQHFWQDRVHGRDLAKCIGDRIFSQVESGRQRIGVIGFRILIGSIVQSRLATADRNFCQFRVFITGDGLVSVFDRPVVIGAERRRVVSGLLHSGRDDIDGRIIHHAGDGWFIGLRCVFHLRQRFPRTGFEVVTQAQSVTHFVHDHFFQGLVQVVLWQFAPFFGQPLCGKNRRSKSRLLLHPLCQSAVTVPTTAGKVK